ncbi:ectoine/hydroxyectoine ABC transporter permease subunit EhuC [Brevibacillus sp. LEMMJ03]|uniref:Ectoine/hydroxyectoine ABC transporter permease subunit EhuC n=1 Tax=Brevibacillus thermoruber TaxID=33942 RepID=A0A9X3Z3R2_9BACL|nr:MULTISPECIES: ectoine/hydroxyectoine ABC transporter permease subunit EhuC [Brevibacillus]MDA5109141.1 ectoine/hydroxyectoine ABC transporter permease subunit EhuC [Brevibacillus thermoruber]TRY26910.1 ectoine/hydroxyectoine ABC transporter permease subunit EhuC [Brevibacillus sp. LEMMJ03]
MSLFDLLPSLAKGAALTVEVTVLSALVAFAASFLAGFGRLSRRKSVRALTAVYVEVFRGTSLLVQLFWLYYALPLLGVELPPLAAGVIALGLNHGAYGSEVVRSAVLAVPRGQTEAAIALNMTPWQRMRRVILPQAFVMMIPSFGNLLIELLKGTSLISLITLADLTFQGMVLRTFDASRTFEIFALVLVVYFALAYPLTLGMRGLERRLTAGRV